MSHQQRKKSEKVPQSENLDQLQDLLKFCSSNLNPQQKQELDRKLNNVLNTTLSELKHNVTTEKVHHPISSSKEKRLNKNKPKTPISKSKTGGKHTSCPTNPLCSNSNSCSLNSQDVERTCARTSQVPQRGFQTPQIPQIQPQNLMQFLPQISRMLNTKEGINEDNIQNMVSGILGNSVDSNIISNFTSNFAFLLPKMEKCTDDELRVMLVEKMVNSFYDNLIAVFDETLKFFPGCMISLLTRTTLLAKQKDSLAERRSFMDIFIKHIDPMIIHIRRLISKEDLQPCPELVQGLSSIELLKSIDIGKKLLSNVMPEDSKFAIYLGLDHCAAICRLLSMYTDVALLELIKILRKSVERDKSMSTSEPNDEAQEKYKTTMISKLFFIVQEGMNNKELSPYLTANSLIHTMNEVMVLCSHDSGSRANMKMLLGFITMVNGSSKECESEMINFS